MADAHSAEHATATSRFGCPRKSVKLQQVHINAVRFEFFVDKHKCLRIVVGLHHDVACAFNPLAFAVFWMGFVVVAFICDAWASGVESLG